MTSYQIVRIVSVLTGAAVLYWLSQDLGLKLYFAIPAGILVYAAVLVALGLYFKVEPPRRR
ncbi:MAG TPA: hypothetical protein VN655_14935 [Pseudolabrys sp.]|jgi:hypothetical protein|nr:hypothetical protein [Pseudolabrys sp.]